MQRRFAAALAFTLCLASAGCGDDEDRLSEEAFLEQGNAICEQNDAEIEAAGAPLFQSDEEPSADEVRAFAEDVLFPNIEDIIEGLDDLNPPEALQSDVDELLDDARAVFADLQAQVDEDPLALFTDEDPFADLNERSIELGLTACGES